MPHYFHFQCLLRCFWHSVVFHLQGVITNGHHLWHKQLLKMVFMSSWGVTFCCCCEYIAEPKVSSKLVVLHHKGPEADVNVVEDGHQAIVIWGWLSKVKNDGKWKRPRCQRVTLKKGWDLFTERSFGIPIFNVTFVAAAARRYIGEMS